MSLTPAELIQIQTTPGTTEIASGGECTLRGTYIDNKTGRHHDLGILSFATGSRLKRLAYTFLRKRGRI